MLSRIKTKLGFAKRGLIGSAKNLFDLTPGIPHRAARHQLGSSVQDRPIPYYTIGNGSMRIIMVAGIHGNEVGSVKACRHALAWLDQQKQYHSQFTFFIVPCLNPDGYFQAQHNPDYWHGGRIGRFNANNVDLNRNFDTPSFKTESVWSRGKNYSETVTVHCGSAPFSEPETKALSEFIQQQNIQVYIAFHNAAADVMGNDHPLAQQLAQAFAQGSGYRLDPPEAWHALSQTGTAREWCDIQRLPYLEIEGRERWSADWPNHRAGLSTVLAELQALL